MSRSPSRGVALNEFAVIQEVARSPGQTQREISRGARLSLGMTNLLLLRLAKKGYIKVRPVDWKRSEYLLTPKGAAEKARVSFRYARHAIELFRRIVESVQSRVRAEHAAGCRAALVVAREDLQPTIAQAVAELSLPDLRVEFFSSFDRLGARPGVVFCATVDPCPEPAEGQRFLSLLDGEDLRYRYPE
jgi:DNA-binding MarR family transcriptional regulator